MTGPKYELRDRYDRQRTVVRCLKCGAMPFLGKDADEHECVVLAAGQSGLYQAFLGRGRKRTGIGG